MYDFYSLKFVKVCFMAQNVILLNIPCELENEVYIQLDRNSYDEKLSLENTNLGSSSGAASEQSSYRKYQI